MHAPDIHAVLHLYNNVITGVWVEGLVVLYMANLTYVVYM